jgi:hypothetical protein
LSGLQSEAEGLLLGGKGAAAEAATAAVAAAAAEMEEAGDVPDAPVVAELGRRPLNYGPKDVLEGMANEEAIAARRVVKGLKLSREELGQELLPEVRGWGAWGQCQWGMVRKCCFLGCGGCREPLPVV